MVTTPLLDLEPSPASQDGYPKKFCEEFVLFLEVTYFVLLLEEKIRNKKRVWLILKDCTASRQGMANNHARPLQEIMPVVHMVKLLRAILQQEAASETLRAQQL